MSSAHKFLFTTLAALPFFLNTACEKSKTTRDATNVSIPEMEPPVTANAPTNLLSLMLLASDESPQICDGDDCPTVAETVKNRLFGDEGSTITSKLDTVDGRIEEIETRSADAYVPCFEETATEATVEFSDDHSFSTQLNCYDLLDDSTESSTGGQLVFGRFETSDEGAEEKTYDYYVIDRYYESADSIRSYWAKQDDSENVELWTASYSKSNDMYDLSHITSTAAGIIEYAIAGSGADDNGNDFICGGRVKMNADYMYINGKVAAPSTGDGGCDDVSSVTYCLDTEDFSSVDVSNCESAEITDFEIEEILPEDIDESAWNTTINVDHADDVSKYTSESLEVEE